MPYIYSYWNRLTNNIIWKHFTLKIYPVKHYFLKFKSDIDYRCTFCDSHPETVVHLFWHCPFLKTFWQNVCDFISVNIDDQFLLTWKHLVFCLLEDCRDNRDQVYLINVIILMAKFYIHKCKFSCKKPCFKTEIEHYFVSIRFSMKQKAVITMRTCKLFNIFF